MSWRVIKRHEDSSISLMRRSIVSALFCATVFPARTTFAAEERKMDFNALLDGFIEKKPWTGDSIRQLIGNELKPRGTTSVLKIFSLWDFALADSLIIQEINLYLDPKTERPKALTVVLDPRSATVELNALKDKFPNLKMMGASADFARDAQSSYYTKQPWGSVTIRTRMGKGNQVSGFSLGLNYHMS